MTSTRKYEIYTGLFIILIMGGGLLTGELGLRVTQLAKYGVSQNVEKSDAFYKDKNTGLRRIKPNQNLGKIRINSLGFRGPDIEKDKPDGTFRVAFLGSSTTYDAYSAEEKNWPHKTILLMKDKNSSCTIDFVNAAQPGHYTDQMLKHYKHFVATTQPDLVIILADDFNHDLNILASEQGLDQYGEKNSWLSDNSVLFAKLEKNYRVIQLQRNAFNHTNKLDISKWKIGQSFKKRLRELVHSIKKDGRHVALITNSSQLRKEQTKFEQLQAGNTALFYMPYIALQDLIKVRMQYNEVIREVAVAEDLILVDGEDDIPGDREHFIDTAHFTEVGANKMAHRVAQGLQMSIRLNKEFSNLHCLK